MKKLHHVKPGDPITAAAYNALVDQVNALVSLTVAPPLMIQRQCTGWQIGLAQLGRVWLFEITSSSPTTATGGDRYWMADRMRLDSTPTWVASTPADYQIYDPVYDRQENIVHLDGERLWAVWNDDTGRWEAITANCTQRLGKTDAAHNKGATGTVSIWSGSPGSEVDTTLNVTAYNRFANVASGKWVWVMHNGDGWYLTAAEC